MKHLEDLPKRHRTHDIQAAAERAFDSLLATSADLIPQGADRSDYGTDVQVEVIDQARATNVRIHVQLKGTEADLNADGSISVSVTRANLNYLFAQPYSLFVCFHLPTGSLRVCSADAVVRKYEHGTRPWTTQDTLTVTFSEPLTTERLKRLAGLARSDAAAARDDRFAQAAAPPEVIPSLIRAAAPHIHVPDEAPAAEAVLRSLGESGRVDASISAAFDRFIAVLGRDHDAMIRAYMAEINLGIEGTSQRPDRILAGIDFLSARIDAGEFMPAGLHYCIGNAFSALSRESEAVEAFERALERWSPAEGEGLRAQTLKNLGGAYERLGDQTRAIALYHEALEIEPQLAEAHHAIAQDALRRGEYAEALDHLDQVIYADGSSQRRLSVFGWRINALFNLGDGKAAFREISSLLAEAGEAEWIWPWCARQVAGFGRETVENARLSLPFWDRYLKANPGCPGGVRERLLNILYLRQSDGYRGPDYAAFRIQFDQGVTHLGDESAAYLWDRLGHWAQDEGDWSEAERCYRRAYDLAGGHYGYCLGTALNFLGRPAEALPLLLEQAERLQPDDMSWSQLASAHAALGRVEEAIEAYERAIALDAAGANAHAWFNLGGLYWNTGNLARALEIWTEALELFPDDDLAKRLRRDFSEIFSAVDG